MCLFTVRKNIMKAAIIWIDGKYSEYWIAICLDFLRVGRSCVSSCLNSVDRD